MAHGRTMEKTSGTAAYTAVDNSLFVRKIIVDPGIYQYKFEPMLPAEKINSGTTMEEVTQLLPGNLFGWFADSFFHDAVVGSEQDVVGMA